jgi:demethylmenaquinone methyltransferase / 2-methoxy-6-polyprenyl-1,4-benzoquinol methylase
MKGRRYPPMSSLTAAAHVGVVRDIFGTVHRRYDLLNHLLSFRRDVSWRAFTTRMMRFGPTRRFLDVATGTADLALAAARRYPAISVTGIDAAPQMLRIGTRKVRDAGLAGRIELLEGDALALPFPDASFDVAAIAFGLRNIPDKLAALREMARVTVPGGRVMVLEMTYAPSAAFRPFYGFYLVSVLPRVAALLESHTATYHYLGDSIMHFPAPARLAALMRESGLVAVRCHRLTFGTAYLHVARVPGAGSQSCDDRGGA